MFGWFNNCTAMQLRRFYLVGLLFYIMLKDGMATVVSPELLGATGKLFSGNRVHIFNGLKLAEISNSSTSCSSLLKTTCQSENWAVFTSINHPTLAVQRTLAMKRWCTIVVADKKTPTSRYKDLSSSNLVFISVERQQRMAGKCPFISVLPWNHFGRKNIGYLFALRNKAELIYDIDDDNVPLKGVSVHPLMSSSKYVMESKDVVGDIPSIINPYPVMGASSAFSWPRGLPLAHITDNRTFEVGVSLLDRERARDVVVYQSLANRDPDVDAIYRLTSFEPSFHFTGDKTLVVPLHSFVPYNAQACIHLKKSFWAMLLPITVSGRVSDIWRSYFAQAIFHALGYHIAFTPPMVVQVRNSHNYLADFQAEEDLYLKTPKLLEWLAQYTYGFNHTHNDLVRAVEQLWIDLYERAYIEERDVILVQHWLLTLGELGYQLK